MHILTPQLGNDYQLIDTGNGHKLEQIGNNMISRPDTNCVWQPAQQARIWQKATARWEKGEGWEFLHGFKEPWIFRYTTAHKESLLRHVLQFELRAHESKNIGIFPEQASQWEWMIKIILAAPTPPSVLNLFGYTGAATLCAAAAGASVCHVDASKAAVSWARKNQALSGLEQASIRWIVDDCKKFVDREIRRGAHYDGLIIDPPAFGRDQKGNQFEFEKQIYALLASCKQLLGPDPRFVIFNGYSMGYSATVLKNLMLDFYPKKELMFGELHLQQANSSHTLPCSLFVRFANV